MPYSCIRTFYTPTTIPMSESERMRFVALHCNSMAFDGVEFRQHFHLTHCQKSNPIANRRMKWEGSTGFDEIRIHDM